MKNLYSLLFCFLLAHAASAQATVWKTLMSVEYNEKYDEELGMDLAIPIYTKDILALNGKTVTIQGYILSLEEFKTEGYRILSFYPFSSCFFCGQAGPETVMEVYSKKALPDSKTPVFIRGVLKVNTGNDPSHLMYMLKDAQVVSGY